MADVQSNIKVSIDTTEALASIKNLQRQISAFHTSMAKSGAAANLVTNQMQQSLINSINATGKFSAQMKTIKTTTESFTSALEKNKFSLGEYFRYAGGASKSFGKLFKTEFDTINKVARENVKDLQTQYIKMGRDANGAMKAIAVRPLSLDMNDLATKTMIASERQALLNQLLKQGSTNLLNFGKNTQWAGRQLMVGFTIPLITVGSQAAKTFMDMETQAIRFKKVYGDLFTPQAETQQALDGIKELGKQFIKYGVAVSDTVGLASQAAAAGFQGIDLQNQTTAATRLSILGQIDNQKALETTISLQNAFGTSSTDLASNIDFLNAVENQTVVSLDDITTAIPKVAPVIKQLGGNVKDLAFFLTAMKEGGINASEGANALKSGLASMINPTKKASAMLAGFGININDIVVKNRGDLKKTVVDFATALNQLDPLNRAQAIEQLFGKFQFARLSTLFANVTKDGTQAARVLDLAGASIQDLASLSEKELGITADSAMTKFRASVENLKLSLIPLGEQFLKVVTPVAEFITKILDKFNGLGDGTKKVIVTIAEIVEGLGPVLLMTFGLLANGVANIIKGFTAIKSLFNKTGQSSATLGTEVKYMTLEQRNAAAVAASLDQVHNTLAQTFTAEARAVDLLTAAYERSIAAQRGFIPTSIPMGRGPIKPKGKFASGGIISGPGGPTSDSIPVMASNGEAIISASIVKKYPGLVNGLIGNNIPGFKKAGIVKPHTGRVSGGTINTGTHSSAGIIAPGNLAGKAEGSTITGMSSSFIGGVTGATPEFQAAASASLKAQMMTLDGVTRITDKAARSYEANWIGIDSHLNEIADIFAKGLTPDIKDISELGQKQFPAMMTYIDNLEKSLQISAQQANTLRESTRKLFNPDLGTANAPGKDAVTKNRQRIETGINAQGQEVVTRVGVERVALPGKSSGDYLDKKTKRLTAREYAKRGLIQPTEKTTFAHIKSGEKVSDYIAPATSKVPTAAEQKILDTLRSGKKVSEGTVLIPAEQGKADAKTYTKTVKDNTKDIYLSTRDRKSPHKQVKKDAKDDVVEYNKTVEKENKKQRSGRATRKQGPAAIGPLMPAGARELPIVAKPQLTRGQSLAAKVRSGAGKVGRLGGGMGLMGANMALGAMPDFAGKNVIQSTMTGASMGMLFGPWGAAAGGAIGLVTTALGALNAKEKEHQAISKSVFTSSASDITFFGGKVIDTTLKISGFAASIKGITTSFGSVTPEIQKFVDYVNQLPKDDPTKVFVEGLKKLNSISSVTGNIRSKVSEAIAIGGMDPKDAQKYTASLLAAAGRSSDFATVWKNVQKSVANESSATTAVLNKLSQGIDTVGNELTGTTKSWYEFDKYGKPIVKTYEKLNTQQKLVSNSLLKLAGALTNGSLNATQFNARLNGIKNSAFNGVVGLAALRTAIVDTGDKTALAGFDSINFALDQIGQKSTEALVKLMALKNAKITPEQAAKFLGKKYAGTKLPSDIKSKYDTQLLLDASSTEGVKKALDKQAKDNAAMYAALNGTNPYVNPATTADGTKKLSAAATAYLKILDAEIKALEKKRDAQKAVNDENQRQLDFQMKQQDLSNQAAQAKISGNYLQASMLEQQKKFAQYQYNQITKENQAQAIIDAKKARQYDIEHGANLTSSESKKIKKATGGLIKGPGTGTSDSIRATLGYAGGGNIRVSNGEYIVRSAAVKSYGVSAMNAVNSGTATITGGNSGGISNTNVTMHITGSNSDDIAKKVMVELDKIQKKNNKSNMVVK